MVDLLWSKDQNSYVLHRYCKVVFQWQDGKDQDPGVWEMFSRASSWGGGLEANDPYPPDSEKIKQIIINML